MLLQHPSTIFYCGQPAILTFLAFCLTVPAQSEYDPEAHLFIGDIAVDSNSSPTTIQVTIKQCKTDPFYQGVQLYLGKKTGSDVCTILP